MERGRKAEIDAVRFLEKKGYRILSSQDRKSYIIKVDDKSEEVTVIADFIVKKNGKIYVVEVKTGKEAPSVRTSSTRRQLLEYFYTFRPDGIILLDMNADKVHTVEFPFSLARKEAFYIYFILGILIGGMIIYLMMRIK